MSIILPTGKKEAGKTEPVGLFIFSQPKVGKTSLSLQLPNSLLIDLESGARHYDGNYIDVKKEANLAGKGQIPYLKELAATIKEENAKQRSHVYDFIIFDNASKLEEMAKALATHNYKKSVIGKDFKGSDVTVELPKGAGYGWLRNAFQEIYNPFLGLAGKCNIVLGHAKLGSITKNGADLQAMDVNLTGALKLMIMMDVDATGVLYREKETSKNYLSFKTTETDLATGSRIESLAGKTILISEKKEDGLHTYWEEVFPSIKQ